MTQSIPLVQLDNDNSIQLYGNGSSLTDKAIKAKCYRKVESLNTMYDLIDYCNEIEDYAFKKQVWQTFHCQDQLMITGDKLYGFYCKNKFCRICNERRKATLTNKYYDEVKTWNEHSTITLTIKSCEAGQLKKMFNELQKNLTLINRSVNHYNKKKGIDPIKIIRTIECGYNEKTNRYNPHIHILTNSEQTSMLIVDKWFKRYPGSTEKHQKIDRIKTLNGLLSWMLYIAKGITQTKHTEALYNILKASKNKKGLISSGFKLQPRTKLNSKVISMHHEKFEFDQKAKTWFNIDTGETLA